MEIEQKQYKNSFPSPSFERKKIEFIILKIKADSGYGDRLNPKALKNQFKACPIIGFWRHVNGERLWKKRR
jgi:hypothetical protein